LQGKVCGGNDSPQRRHLPRTASRHGNLLPLSGQYLSHSEGLGDELEGKKQQGRSKAAALSTAATGILRAAGNFINTALQRATRRFIRRVSVWICKQATWRDSIARLRQVRASTSAWFSAPIFLSLNLSTHWQPVSRDTSPARA
jgi:hypothetical protein